MALRGIPTSRSSLATSLSSCKMPSSCPITIFMRLRILSLSQLLLLLLQLLLLLLGWSLGCLSWQVWESILPYRPRFPAPTALSILLPSSRVAWRPRSPSRPGTFQHLNVPLPPRKSQPQARLPARSGGSGLEQGDGLGCTMRSWEHCRRALSQWPWGDVGWPWGEQRRQVLLGQAGFHLPAAVVELEEEEEE